ncbi:MAG TPA: YbgC/FadM family acyl-CoA thioesterase [Candidatus Omnitrophica bacterium]|nr:MAG: hypothetical protein DRP61_03225 [Candidatus Omnitrophota bacterium]RKY34437.1 MAG: hypothetical protein DRP69_04670 [Candidatus Omnitrophota bacterium]RKY44067.1 MAG: hypothetical protein DRP80_03410 [Candidatus Omnitrophota bacterium]HEC68898.1 YbgC/FadM family acyl-CoA thioesterase [Candidatus Omnitrophota bacterium]HEC69292.1 YbgC/FadM family acyl-CoA thioesterase [Candidatus Omnitrophota bacterium]
MHSLFKKIYYHDTDKAGVVYYANYLKYFEEARTEFFLVKGVDIKELAEEGILFVVRRIEVDYKYPAFYGQEIEVVTEAEKVKNVSILFSQYVKDKDSILVESKALLVCVNEKFKPRAVPPGIRDKLSGLQNNK